MLPGDASNLRHGSLSAIMASVNQSQQKSGWPFNPNFPQAFSFPAFGSVEWLALAWWQDYKGDASNIPDADKIRAGTQLNWQCVWKNIYAQNSVPPPPPDWIPDTAHFSMKHPEGWVQTLLDAERFWLVEINIWAMQMVGMEFEEKSKKLLAALPFPSDANQCEQLCCRFHAWQQARYRWHEHLLEKHCERALGGRALNGHNPTTASEARAALIGWLSKQRGYAGNPLVKEFRRAVRAKNSMLSLNEKKTFCAERTHPSNRRYRASPDEMGWLILTWPVWNFDRWQWTQVGGALIEKFRSVDAKGKTLDFWPDTVKQFQKILRGKQRPNSPSRFNELAEKLFTNPTPKENEMHEDWKRTVRSRGGEKAFEQLARLAIGKELEKQIEPRPRGRGAGEKPALWDFTQQISA